MLIRSQYIKRCTCLHHKNTRLWRYTCRRRSLVTWAFSQVLSREKQGDHQAQQRCSHSGHAGEREGGGVGAALEMTSVASDASTAWALTQRDYDLQLFFSFLLCLLEVYLRVVFSFNFNELECHERSSAICMNICVFLCVNTCFFSDLIPFVQLWMYKRY